MHHFYLIRSETNINEKHQPLTRNLRCPMRKGTTVTRTPSVVSRCTVFISKLDCRASNHPCKRSVGQKCGSKSHKGFFYDGVRYFSAGTWPCEVNLSYKATSVNEVVKGLLCSNVMRLMFLMLIHSKHAKKSTAVREKWLRTQKAHLCWGRSVKIPQNIRFSREGHFWRYRELCHHEKRSPCLETKTTHFSVFKTKTWVAMIW